MYLVLTVQNNRVINAKAFKEWYRATLHADKLAIALNQGVSKEMMDWENSGYRNVYEHNGTAIMIEPCEMETV